MSHARVKDNLGDTPAENNAVEDNSGRQNA